MLDAFHGSRAIRLRAQCLVPFFFFLYNFFLLAFLSRFPLVLSIVHIQIRYSAPCISSTEIAAVSTIKISVSTASGVVIFSAPPNFLFSFFLFSFLFPGCPLVRTWEIIKYRPCQGSRLARIAGGSDAVLGFPSWGAALVPILSCFFLSSRFLSCPLSLSLVQFSSGS